MYTATLIKENDSLIYSFSEISDRTIGQIYSGKYKDCFVVKIDNGNNEPILSEITGLFYMKGQDLIDLGKNIKLLEPNTQININVRINND